MRSDLDPATLERVLDAFDQPLCLIDVRDYQVRLANSAALGGSDLWPVTCYRLLHERDSPCLDPDHPCPLAEIRTTGEPVTVLHRHRGPDGELHNVEVRAEPVYEDGELRFIAETAVDISERERVSQERDREHRFLERVVNAVSEGILGLDAEGRITLANQAAADLLGRARASLIGRRSEEVLWAPELDTQDDTPGQAPWHATLADGEVRQGDDLHLRRADGSARPVAYHTAPLAEGSGAAGAVLAFRDISDRIAARQALLDKEALFRQMFENSQAVQLLIDPDSGTILDANPAACAFYGYSRDRLTELTIDAINTLSAGDVAAERHRAEAGQRNYFQFRHRLADGSVREVEVYSGPVSVGGQSYLHSIIHDITEKKEYWEHLETYEELFEHLPVGVYRNTPGPHGRFLEVNQAMVEIFEADSRAELLATPVSRLYRDTEGRTDFSEALMGGDEDFHRQELELTTLKGRPLWALVTAQKRRGRDGRPLFDGIVEDITERKRTEQALRKSERRYRGIIDSTDEGFWMLGPQTQETVDVNAALGRMLGYGREEMLGRLPTDFVDAEQTEWFRAQLAGLAHSRHCSFEVTLTHRDGSPLPALFNASRFVGETGEAEFVFAFVTDITERKELEAELELRATTDPLTGLHNRYRFQELLSEERERVARGGPGFAVAMFDLDHFKAINDRYGHAVGDGVLEGVGELARNNLREADEVARWGGEEFLALLPQTGLQGAADWAERLRERAAAAEPYGVDDLTLSFGVAEYRPGESLAMLIKRADDALYEAKAAGRNRVAVASEE